MVRVVIKRYGKSPKELLLDLENQWFEFQAEALDVGKSLHIFVKEYIKNHAKRPGYKGKIADAISYDESIEMGKVSFAIGDIAQLDEKTNRAWRAVNWGSSHMVGRKLPVGYFRPGQAKPDRSHFREGRWYSTGGTMSKYAPYVKMPIPPMYFVEALITKGREAIFNLINKFLERVKGKK